MATVMMDRSKFGLGGTAVHYLCKNGMTMRLDQLVTPMYEILVWCVENLDGNVFFERDPISQIEQNFGSQTNRYVLWFSDPDAAFAFKMRWK